MSRVLKWTLEDYRTPQRLAVPKGSDLLYAREQHESVCIWFRESSTPIKDPVSSSTEIEYKWVALSRTGLDECPPADKSRYLGSAHMHGGSFIIHVFELTDVR